MSKNVLMNKTFNQFNDSLWILYFLKGINIIIDWYYNCPTISLQMSE